MLTLGLYFIQVLWAYNICIEFNPCQFVQKLSLIYLTLYIDRCILLTSLADGILFFTMIHAGSIQLLVMHYLFRIHSIREISMHVLRS